MSMERVENPFQAPAARVADHREALADDLRAEVRVTSAGDAMGWIEDGWRLFKEAPGTWIGMLVVFVVLFIGASLIPFLGMLAGLLYPVFAGGIMLGCRSLDAGEGLGLRHLFDGFRHQTGNLLLVGVINLVLTIGVIVLIGVGVAGSLGAAAALSFSAEGAGPAAAIAGLVAIFLLTLLLTVPITMASWFAPALVALNGVSPVEAMKLSFIGCLRNPVPFLIYGLALLALTIVAVLPIGLGFLVLMPVVWGSMFFSYRDIFVK